MYGVVAKTAYLDDPFVTQFLRYYVGVPRESARRRPVYPGLPVRCEPSYYVF